MTVNGLAGPAHAARVAGIDTCTLARSGGHDFMLRRRTFGDALPWLAWRVHLMDDHPHVPATGAAGAS